MKKDFIRYYLITGLKPVVNMYRSSGTSSPNFSPLFSGRLSIPSFFALNLLKFFIPGELHWGQETTRTSFFRKVCLAAFAESEFGNPLYFTGLKPVVNMYHSSGTSSPNFSPLFSGRLSIPSFFALNLLKIFIPGELHWGQETTRKSFFRKVCLAAFAESEFGNPFYKGRSWIMGWQIPICQKGRRPLQSFKRSMPHSICRIGVRQPIERRPLKEVCLPAFAESEFGNPFILPNRSSAIHRPFLN